MFFFQAIFNANISSDMTDQQQIAPNLMNATENKRPAKMKKSTRQTPINHLAAIGQGDLTSEGDFNLSNAHQSSGILGSDIFVNPSHLQ